MRSRPARGGGFDLRLLGAAAGLLALLAACRAVPPAHRVDVPAGTVRAEQPERARESALDLEELAPRVAALLPAARQRPLEVWIQEEPRLFRFGRPAHEEADGFWALGPGRIHLRTGADDLRRTLAHELVHAFLDSSWDTLPGTLEEGLCDLISARAAPDGALRMRAGRLSAAAFCLGGLALRIEVGGPRAADDIERRVGVTVVLESELEQPLVPEQVFEVRAGLSTTRMEPGRKKALYGLAYLLVERVVRNIGLEGLHELCLRARAEGLASVPSAWLLAAAELPSNDLLGWRRALEAELGPAELRALVGMYPEFLLTTVAHLWPDWSAGEALSVTVATAAGQGALELLVIAPARILDGSAPWGEHDAPASARGLLAGTP